MTDDIRTPSGAALGAALLAVLTALASAAAVAVHVTTPAGERVGLLGTPEVTVAPALAAVGALLVRSRDGRRVGALLLLIGVCAAGFSLSWALAARTGAGAAVWLAGWVWAPAFLPFALVLPLVFPDGRLPSRHWWPVLAAAVALTATTSVGLALAPREVAPLPGETNPLGVGALEPVVDVLQVLFAVGTPLLALAALAAVAVRARRGTDVERRQLAWFGTAVALAVVLSFVGPAWARHLSSLAVPGAVLLAVLRYRLFALDVVVRRAAVAAVLLSAAALGYVAVAGWAGALLGDESAAGYVGAVALALAAAPAQARVRRAVDRLLYGDRGDPYRLLTAVDTRVRAATSPSAALREVVAAVAEGLRLPGVAVEIALPDGRTVREETGALPPAATAVDLTWQGTAVGRLTAAPRSGEDRLGELDLRLLADLAGPVAALGHALALTADLARSRETAIAAREEERRRLRRDLHDGLGPQLAGVVMLLESAAAAVGRDDERARRLARSARDRAEEAVVDVRRLVHGLRPPALDDLGLVGALRAAHEHDGTGPRVEVDASGDLRGLPAAVEVAAFRIAQESLTNVVRHSGAARAVLRLRVEDDALLVEVCDDGTGIGADARAGVGLESMRERAAELGGTCTVEARREGGTRVVARLPRQR